MTSNMFTCTILYQSFKCKITKSLNNLQKSKFIRLCSSVNNSQIGFVRFLKCRTQPPGKSSKIRHRLNLNSLSGGGATAPQCPRCIRRFPPPSRGLHPSDVSPYELQTQSIDLKTRRKQRGKTAERTRKNRVRSIKISTNDNDRGKENILRRVTLYSGSGISRLLQTRDAHTKYIYGGTQWFIFRP